MAFLKRLGRGESPDRGLRRTGVPTGRCRLVFRRLSLLGLLLLAGEALALKLDVRVQGLQGAEQANVLALLAIYRERNDTALDETRLRALHRLAPEQIRDALAPFGLYRVQVQDTLTPPANASGAWVATYRVDPGPPIAIAAVHYRVTGEGASNPAFPKQFPMKVGDVLLHSRYEQAKADLRFAASSEGYLDYALIKHQVLIDPVAYNAVIAVELDTGPRFYFGPVTFKQDLLNDGFLQRYVKFKPGDVYDPDVLLDLQARLLGTEYFEKVEIVPQRDPSGTGRMVPIEVIAERSRANRFRVGLGFATDIGPRLSFDWRRRYLNRWGHYFRNQLSLSPALSEWNFDYRIPIRDPLRDYWRINPNVTYYDNTTREGWIALLHVARSTVSGGGWRRDIGIDYRYEDFTIDDVETDAVNELVPSIAWAKTVTDDPVYTTRGYRLKYSVLGSLAGVVSPTSYLSANLDFKWIRAFAKRYRFLTRADLGATLAGSVDDLPASRRFYAGGDNSIRGWGYDALGPNDPVNDQTVGGRYLAVGSLELERRIVGDWSAAVFTDFGNAFDPQYQEQWEQSVGVGVRWRSPIGQVRLDLAFALTKDAEGERYGLPPARLHFVIGPDL